MDLLEEELSSIQLPGPTLVTIGVYDGVHLGHQHLLRQLMALAGERSLTPCVLTFKNHPLTVLSSETRILCLSTGEEKGKLLRAFGIPVVAEISFTREVSLLTARQFLVLLQRQLKTRGLVVGPDFVMGHNREADVPALRRLGKETGLTVDMAQPYTIGGEVVSSTAIRRALAAGDLHRAVSFLGRPFTIKGRVVQGYKRGRNMGFPTANIDLPAELALPGDGVYATKVHIGGRTYLSATNIGVRPTFGSESERTVEAYIMDFQGDLYGKVIKIEVVERMRDELFFNNIEELKIQMQKDVEQVRALLGSR